VKPDLVLELAIAPAAVLTRISSAINRKRQRAFGIFKTQNEYLGHVHDGYFEIWERQQRAVHAVGSVRGRSGGSHIEVRFLIPTQTRVLTAVFFALYAVVAVGLAFRSPQDTVTIEKALAAGGGALALIAIFALAAVRQRHDLRGFVNGLFGDVPRI